MVVVVVVLLLLLLQRPRRHNNGPALTNREATFEHCDRTSGGGGGMHCSFHIVLRHIAAALSRAPARVQLAARVLKMHELPRDANGGSRAALRQQ